MQIKYHSETDRKKLVAAAAEQLGETPRYAGAPTMAYKLGAFTVTREKALTGPDDRDLGRGAQAAGLRADRSAIRH